MTNKEYEQIVAHVKEQKAATTFPPVEHPSEDLHTQPVERGGAQH